MSDFIFVRESNVIRRLVLNDILYAEAVGDYIRLYTQGRLYVVHGTMKQAEVKLPQDKFLRVHRCYIVAVGKIDTIQEGGIVIDGKFLPVADTYRKVLHQRINVF